MVRPVSLTGIRLGMLQVANKPHRRDIWTPTCSFQCPVVLLGCAMPTMGKPLPPKMGKPLRLDQASWLVPPGNPESSLL